MGSPIALMMGASNSTPTLSSGAFAPRARRKNTLFAGHDEGGMALPLMATANLQTS